MAFFPHQKATANNAFPEWEYDHCIKTLWAWKHGKGPLPSYSKSKQKEDDDKFEKAELASPQWMISAGNGWQHKWRGERREDFYMNVEWNAKIATLTPRNASFFVAIGLWAVGLLYHSSNIYAYYVLCFVLVTHILESLACLYITLIRFKWGWLSGLSFFACSFIYGYPCTSVIVGLFLSNEKKK